jgi:small subunit ribosomal protein S8
MSLQSTDPVADLLTRIRNAVMVGKHEITLPSSKFKLTILKELKKARYIVDVKVQKEKPRDVLVVTLSNEGENSPITEIDRVSRPGRRVYVSALEVPRVKSGRGIVLISTSKGILTGYQAYKQKIGGEVLLKVY